MIVPNASITSYGKATGATGDGKPVIAVNALTDAIACRVAEISDALGTRMQSQGVALDRVIEVNPQALLSQQIDPAPQDRLALMERDANGVAGAARLFVIVDVRRPAGGGMFGAIPEMRLLLAEANDGVAIP